MSVGKLASTVAGQPEAYMLGGADESSDADAMVAYRASDSEELEEEMKERATTPPSSASSGTWRILRSGSKLTKAS